MNIPNATDSAGEAPEIEDGLYVARFEDVAVRVVEQFITEKDQFGKPDDGTRFDLLATILDEDRAPVVKSNAEDPDDFLTLRQAKSIKKFSSDDRSNAYMYLKGILTGVEMSLWAASGKGDEAADAAWAAAGAKVNGREVNVQVSHNAKGWPQIEAFLGAAKPLKK